MVSNNLSWDQKKIKPSQKISNRLRKSQTEILWDGLRFFETVWDFFYLNWDFRRHRIETFWDSLRLSEIIWYFCVIYVVFFVCFSWFLFTKNTLLLTNDLRKSQRISKNLKSGISNKLGNHESNSPMVVGDYRGS